MINIIIYSLLFIFALLLLMLVFPSHVIISYNDSLSIKLRILYIPITLFPFPFKITKKVNKKVNTGEKNYPENKLSNKINNKNIFQNLKSFNQILNILNDLSKKILRHVKINLIYLNLGIKGNDASDIAIKYAKYQFLVSNIISRINCISSVKKYKVIIYPDFWESDKSIKFTLDIYSRLGFILYELLIFSHIYAKIKNKLK